MKRALNNSVSLLHEPSRGKRCWLVRWWGTPNEHTGKQKRYSKSFEHQRDAKAFQAEKQAELNRGLARDPVVLTLEELVREFEETRLSTLSYASQVAYKNTTDQMLEYFGRQRKIVVIKTRHAEAFMATRKRRDDRVGELSGWSRLRHLMHARAVFAAAVAWGYLNENPFRVSAGSGASSLRVNPKSRPWHHLTPEEFVRLQNVVPTARKRAANWFQYGCGLRPGEVYNLRVSNIDLSQRRVQIVNREASEDTPPFTVKADGQSGQSKERWVPIPDAAIPDITEAVKEAFKSGGFIALSPARFRKVQDDWRLCRQGLPWGGHSWRPWQNRDLVNNVLRDTKRHLRRAKITLTAPFQLTTFRKSYAQNLANAGVAPRTLARLLGHTDTRVTMKHYATVTDSNERQAGELMSRLLSPQQEALPQRKQG